MIADNQQQPLAKAFTEQIPTELAALALSSEQLTALGRQGFVCAEYRGKRGPFYKLRFRSKKRQVVRYLGKDAEAAERIRLAVIELQADRRIAQQLRHLTTQAREVLRATKLNLCPELRAAGFEFHGLAIRKKRRGQDQKVAAPSGADSTDSMKAGLNDGAAHKNQD